MEAHKISFNPEDLNTLRKTASVRTYADVRGVRVTPNRLFLRELRTRAKLPLHKLAQTMALLAAGKNPENVGSTNFTITELSLAESYEAKLRRVEHGYSLSLTRHDWETLMRALARIVGWVDEVAA